MKKKGKKGVKTPRSPLNSQAIPRIRLSPIHSTSHGLDFLVEDFSELAIRNTVSIEEDTFGLFTTL